MLLLLHFAGNHCRGPTDIPHDELFHNSAEVSGGGILGINNVFAIASHFSARARKEFGFLRVFPDVVKRPLAVPGRRPLARRKVLGLGLGGDKWSRCTMGSTRVVGSSRGALPQSGAV